MLNRTAKIFLMTLIMITIVSVAMAADRVECYQIMSNQSVTAGGSAEAGPILLTAGPSATTPLWKVKSGGRLSIQPAITAGTFTINVYWSNYSDPTSHWSSATTIATGLTSTDTDPIEINPGGPHLWMKVEVVETGGVGSPQLSLSLCSD